MRIAFRLLATLLLAGSVVTCSDAPTAAPSPANAGGRRAKGVLSFTPVFSAAAAAVYAQRSLFADANFDHVRVAIVRPPLDTLTDTTVVFTPASPDLTLDLTVEMIVPNETFSGVIQYLNSTGKVFEGRYSELVAHVADEPAPPQQKVVLAYVGPGANATKLVVAPKTPIITAPALSAFTATVFDDKNATIPNVPVVWTTSDPSIATISSAGVLTTIGKRGTVTVTAKTLTGVSDNATATITLPAATILLVSGGGQTGQAGHVLAQPAVVRVAALDGVGVPGVPVTFAAAGGGKVSPASATTDVSGSASTTLTVGSTVGPQSFAAVAGGVSVSIPETVIAGDAANITPFAGGGQSDTITHVLKNPLVVKVTDGFGNAVSGILVNWARTAGTGSVSALTSLTNSLGLASSGYTLGEAPGNETISASVSGVATPATFTVQALAAATPTIALSSTTLNFRGTQGSAGPPSQTIAITNGGTGTLDGLSVGPVNYGNGPTAWLQTTLSSSVANPVATLGVQPVIGTLAAGTYTATISVLSNVATNSPQNITVSFVVGSGAQLLSVNGGGTGSGGVSSSAGGIACAISSGTTSGTCSASYPFGTNVTLSAAPSGASAFAGWSGGGCSGTASCVVAMTQARSVTASFTPPCTLTLSANPPAGGTASGAGTYVCGATVTLVATPSAGYAFANWTENGSSVSTNASFQITLPSSRTLVANFIQTPTQCTVVVSASPSAGGTATGGGTFACGTAVTVVATAGSGYAFANWTESGTVVAGVGATYAFPATNRTLVANFTQTPTQCTIAVSANPSTGGTATGGGTFACGTSVTVVATAGSGYSFANWTEGGIVVAGVGATYSFLAANRTLVANFAQTPAIFSLTVTGAAGTGVVTSSPPGINCVLTSGVPSGTCIASFASGAVVSLSAAPGAGQIFSSWAGACAGAGTCTVTMTSDKSVGFSFIVAPQYALTLVYAGAGGGGVQMNPPGGAGCVTIVPRAICSVYASGTGVTMTASANTGSAFAGWSGACVGTGACQITMSASTTVTATFTLAPPTVQTTAAFPITATNEEMNGVVGGIATLTQIYFQWGTTTALGLETARSLVSQGTAWGYNLTGLAPNTTYYYRAVASNANGVSFGATLSFTTIP